MGIIFRAAIASSSSVIIDNRDVVRVAVAPGETDPPLVVDADAVLPGAITAQLLQLIARRDAQVVQDLGRVDCDEFAERDPTQLGRKPAHRLASKEACGVATTETLDHLVDINAMRY